MSNPEATRLGKLNMRAVKEVPEVVSPSADSKRDMNDLEVMAAGGMGSSKRRLRILIADDESAVRGALRMMLSNDRFEVKEASDGAEAIEALRSSPAEVVLLDLKMPRLGGMAALQEIRRCWPETKVIAVSGGNTSSDEPPLEQALVAGASYMIEKPVCRDRLLTALALVLH